MTTNTPEGSNPTTEQVIRVVVSSSPIGDSSTEGGAKVWNILKSALELLAKLLPGVAILVTVFLFRAELSEFLRNASKVEVFGFKLEKGEFDKRLQAADKLNLSSKSPAWAEVPFRKLKLAGPRLKGMRLLWVDDHPENNFYLRRILGDIGVEVAIATSNTEAIELAKRRDFDFVISDFNRDPPLLENGGELARQLTALSYDAPVLFYTSQPENVPSDAPHVIATNDPARLLSTVAELAIEKSR